MPGDFQIGGLSCDEALSRLNEALRLAFNHAQTDGAHHKAWCIDQMVRALTDDKYEVFLTVHNDGEDGPNTYEWEPGIAP